MASINMNGRLANEMTVKAIEKNGTNVIIGNFRMAVNNGSGENQKTVFVQCTVFGKYAQTLSKILKKGMFVSVTADFDYFKPVDSWLYNNTVYNAVRVVVSKVDYTMNTREQTVSDGVNESDVIEAVEVPAHANEDVDPDESEVDTSIIPF